MVSVYIRGLAALNDLNSVNIDGGGEANKKQQTLIIRL
jgi:hypothetical protein